jgi:hypothetical protein
LRTLAEFGSTNPSIRVEIFMDVRHRYLRVCATLTALSLSVLWMNVLVATTDERSTVSWNDAEVTAFLDYLLANKSQMGESGSFPQAVYNSAATEIAKHRASGPPKSGKSCKSKWSTVSNQSDSVLITLSFFRVFYADIVLDFS